MSSPAKVDRYSGWFCGTRQTQGARGGGGGGGRRRRRRASHGVDGRNTQVTDRNEVHDCRRPGRQQQAVQGCKQSKLTLLPITAAATISIVRLEFEVIRHSICRNRKKGSQPWERSQPPFAVRPWILHDGQHQWTGALVPSCHAPLQHHQFGADCSRSSHRGCSGLAFRQGELLCLCASQGAGTHRGVHLGVREGAGFTHRRCRSTAAMPRPTPASNDICSSRLRHRPPPTPPPPPTPHPTSIRLLYFAVPVPPRHLHRLGGLAAGPARQAPPLAPPRARLHGRLLRPDALRARQRAAPGQGAGRRAGGGPGAGPRDPALQGPAHPERRRALGAGAQRQVGG